MQTASCVKVAMQEICRDKRQKKSLWLEGPATAACLGMIGYLYSEGRLSCAALWSLIGYALWIGTGIADNYPAIKKRRILAARAAKNNL